MKVIIRSVTLHFKPKIDNARIDIEKAIGILEEVGDFIHNTLGKKIFSLRLSLPPANSVEEVRVLSKAAEEYLDKYHVSGFPIDSRWRKGYEVVEELVASGFYTSIVLMSATDAYPVSKLIYRLSERNPIYPTRIGVELSGCPPLTPYFPLSHHKGPLISYVTLALIYNRDILDCMEKGNDILECFGVLHNVFDRLIEEWRSEFPPFAGIDYSMSPWMDDSTSRVIEDIGECVIGETRCYTSISLINKILRQTALAYGGVGFNEVMLPLAEDNVLKKRAREGSLTLSNLIHYTTACLAGLDMTPIKTGTKMIANVLVQLREISLNKNKSMGARIIPLPEDFSETEVDLGFFGKVPVLEPGL